MTVCEEACMLVKLLLFAQQRMSFLMTVNKQGNKQRYKRSNWKPENDEPNAQ